MKYIVYIHTTPNDKIYIGISSKSNANKRWRNGNGYQKNKYFFSAILKYGWDNIEHKILFEDLEEEEAKQKETELIQKYKSNDRNYGYNLSSGGESSNGYKHTKEQIEKQKRNRKKPQYTKETRLKMSVSAKRVWENPEYKEEMRKKIKEAYKNGKINNNKGKHLSKETIEKIKRTRKIKYIKCLETNEIYRGTRDISEKLNIDRRSVMRKLQKGNGVAIINNYHIAYTRNTEFKRVY
jgi:group I intron endonuclease